MAWESPVPVFRGLDMGELGTDQAYLNISSPVGGPMYVYTLSQNCHLCPYQLEAKLDGRHVLKAAAALAILTQSDELSTWRCAMKSVLKTL